MPGIMSLFDQSITPDAASVVSMATATAFMTRQPAAIDAVVLDCSINETHALENEVTDHPVENGADITDHVRPKPDVITIEGLVSNTPMTHAQRTRMINQLGITLSSASDADYLIGVPGYAEAAFAALRALRDNGTLFTVQTSLYTYNNMVMVSLTVPRNKDIGDALRFTCQCKSIRLVSNQLVPATIQANPAKKIATGKQATGAASAANQDNSILYDLKTSVSGVMKKFGIGGGS